MLKKMFTGRKRVPFLSQDTRGDNSVEPDDTEPKASCSNPSRTQKTEVTYESKCMRVTKCFDGRYKVHNDSRYAKLNLGHFRDGFTLLCCTQEELQCLKDMLNTMEELN